MEEFSLDSEAEDPPAPTSPPISGPDRRYSAPTSLQPPGEKRPTKAASRNPRTVLISNPDEEQYPSCSKSCNTFPSSNERGSPTSDERTLKEEASRREDTCVDMSGRSDPSRCESGNEDVCRDMSKRPMMPLPQECQEECTRAEFTRVTIEEEEFLQENIPSVIPSGCLSDETSTDESMQGKTFLAEACVEDIPLIVESKLSDDESSTGGASDLELRSMQHTPKLIAQKSKSDPSITEEHHGPTIMTLTLATSLSCDQLVKHLQMKEKQTLASNSIHFLPWPQETLF